MKGHKPKSYSQFPDPMAPASVKASESYGIAYAKSIEAQWGGLDDFSHGFGKRLVEFNRNRDYANGTQDTSIYKQILNSMDTQTGDGTLLNLDFTPVPILPKFVRIVVNKILSRKFRPNVEAIDPMSKDEKEKKKILAKFAIEEKEVIEEAKSLGLNTTAVPDGLPDNSEEAEIYLADSIKTSAEVAAQLATKLTLDWNDFDDVVFRRAVEDLVVNGMAVVKRSNDPTYGIKTEYVDPAQFIHSSTEDPSFSDIVYAGHVKRMSIQELKRVAGTDIPEEEYKKIAKAVMNRTYNNAAQFNQTVYDRTRGTHAYGYDEYLVDVLDFEFLGVDDMIYEEKTSQFGNIGFYYKGESYKLPSDSVYDRKIHTMPNMCVYGGSYVIGSGLLFGYGMKRDIPKNMHDLTRARLSYSVVATNFRRQMPKSMVSSVIGFADQLQLTHLKIQQAIAKAKPDGLIVDIEGLENVQLGAGGELQPLDIQDIYEQTGVFYYSSKNPEGGFQHPPVRPLDNTIRNINELIGLYNHYLRMIRDVTGVNEVLDGSSPKGDALVGVRQQQLAAGNNAINDITNGASVLYKRVCDDVVKCLQVLPPDSIIYEAYERAIGTSSMEILSSFAALPLHNYGVIVEREMSEEAKLLLEQNIQQSLAQREIDLEDAMAIRRLKDLDQAERLLIIRRKRRIAALQQQQQQQMQMQAQVNMQSQQAAAQLRMQEVQMKGQIDMQKIQAQGQVELQVLQARQQIEGQVQMAKMQMNAQAQASDKQFRMDLEKSKDDRKDSRVDKQAVAQSKLISQRKGTRPELEDQENRDVIQELMRR